MRVPLALLAALLAAPLALGVAPPSAEPVVLALPGAWLTQYATPAMVVQPGGSLSLLNADIMYHDVVSRQTGPDGQPWCGNFAPGACPLFWSRLASIGEQVPVLGVEHARAGATYTFYCTRHSGMQGTLVVLPA